MHAAAKDAGLKHATGLKITVPWLAMMVKRSPLWLDCRPVRISKKQYFVRVPERAPIGKSGIIPQAMQMSKQYVKLIWGKYECSPREQKWAKRK